ncbi:hypothetical protein SAMN04487917_1088 [Arthrobacter sp. yr096]|nr:hypothetical protein SAMN04487917_1088 [Arthrobacter sp. yr096]
MMGDKFQLGPFNDVIVGGRQRVTPGTNFFEKFFRAYFPGAIQRRRNPRGADFQERNSESPETAQS